MSKGACAHRYPYQRRSAQKRYNPLRSVVAARLMPASYQFLKNLAEHLGVNGDFHIERSAFGYGEVGGNDRDVLMLKRWCREGESNPQDPKVGGF